MDYPKIYFDEKLHKYTDEYGNVLTSVTTAIGKYVNKFDTDKMARICAKIGRDPSHAKYHKYKNKTEKQLKKEWEATTNEALDKGNRKHNYLEDAIKASNNYKRVKGAFINDRIFTIPDIISNPSVGIVTLDVLRNHGVDTKYPVVFGLLEQMVDNGWKLYAEIGVFNSEYLISGLIDLLAVRGNKFFIIDWKTNKAPIRFEAGYFDKDQQGNLTNTFISKTDTLKYPLHNIPDSTGHKYSLQLSGYAYLTEFFNMELSGILLCHIRDVDDVEQVTIHNIKYMKNEIKDLLDHHLSTNKLTNQSKLFV